jgi:alkylation response protein AidB-like acyl-CoA dehydrogenase
MHSTIALNRQAYATEEHQMLQTALDEFLNKEAVPNYEEWENQKRVPKSFWRKMGEQGFLCVDMPEQYGGGGLDFTFSALVLERTRYAGIDFGIAVHSDIVAPYILKYGSEAQKQKYLPKMATGEWVGSIGMSEPSAGSDLKSLKTTAIDMGDHYLINGSKTFITNGYVAEFVLCACRTNVGTSSEGISLIFIDKSSAGFTTGQPFDKLGAKAQDTCELFFEDVKVPKDNLLGEEGMGFKYMMTELSRERLSIAIEAIGSAEGILDKTLQYVTERRAFKKALAEFQNTQFKLADCAAELQVYQSYIDHCSILQSQKKLSAVQGSISKMKATDMYGKVVDECLQLHGGYGFIWEYDVARSYAAARVTRIYGGTNEIMKLIISRALFSEFYKKNKAKKQLVASS